MAILGDEAEVERQLRAYADAGATDLIATVLSVDSDSPDSSEKRTRELLKSLLGKI